MHRSDSGSGRLRAASLLAWLLLAALPALAQTSATPHVEATLITETPSVEPGRPFHAALRLRLEKGWHVYWKNPGDAGQAVSIEWELPEGVVAGPIIWPYPERLGAPPEVSYGYEEEVVLPVLITPAAIRSGSLTLHARATWLVCNDVCLSQKSDLTLSLPIGDATHRKESPDAGLIRAALDREPRRPTGLVVDARRTAGGFDLRLSGNLPAGGALPRTAYFFPAEEGVLDHSAVQPATIGSSAIELVLPASPYASAPPDRLRGVLVAGEPGGKPAMVLEIDAPLPAATQ